MIYVLDSKVIILSFVSHLSIALLDLCIAMVPFAGSEGLKKMFDLSLPRLQVREKVI